MHPASFHASLVACSLLPIGTVACRATPEVVQQPDDSAESQPGPPGTASADENPTDPPDSSGGRGGTAASTGGSHATKDAPGGSSGDGGSPNADADADAGSPSVEPSDPEEPPSTICAAQSVTFDEIRAGSVRSNVKVEVEAVATSQKFLLSHAKSGSCLFGAFVGLAPDASGPRGLLVVSYGDDAPDGAACPTDKDAIPAALAPGDAVSGVGYVTSYAPSGCSAVPAPQLMLDTNCPLALTGRRDAPTPFALTREQADAIAEGRDATTLRAFAGGLVRLENVSARPATEGVGSVGPYGVVTLNETSLELHNDLEYGDLTLGGPGDPQKSLVLPYPTLFTSVTGLVYLDYCTWSLTPRSRCDDLTPPSDGCPRD